MKKPTAKEQINKLFEDLLSEIKNDLQKHFKHNLKIEDNIIWDGNKMICALLQNSELFISEEYQKYFEISELFLLEDDKNEKIY